MRANTARSIDYSAQRDQRRYYRVERRYSSQRQAKELVRDLLRAHSSK